MTNLVTISLKALTIMILMADTTVKIFIFLHPIERLLSKTRDAEKFIFQTDKAPLKEIKLSDCQDFDIHISDFLHFVWSLQIPNTLP